MARLIVNAGTPEAREVVLKEGVNTLGRGEGNDFIIADASVSGSHCEVIVANGAVRVLDRGSTNGTFVNGVPITEVNLQAGQQLQLGSVPLRFEADDHGAVAAPAPTGSRLRISHGATHAPPVAEAAANAPVAAAPVATLEAPANAMCKYHPRTLARWQCTGCHKTYCDLCVSDRAGAGAGGQKFCRSCGGMARALDVALEPPAEKSFFRELPRAATYPFRGAGPLILVFATLLFAALEFLSFGIFGLLIKALALGYLFSYMQNIIHSTAAGDEALPDMPGMDDLLSGFFRLAGTVLISFGPALVLAYFAIAQEEPMAGIALIPAVIFGALYMPMAFLAVALKDNVMASNPLVVVPSILRVPLEYLVAAVLVAGLFGVRWLGDALTGIMAGPFDARTTTEMLVTFAVRAVWAFLSVYLLTVTMRILGLLYLTKRERLGW